MLPVKATMLMPATAMAPAPAPMPAQAVPPPQVTYAGIDRPAANGNLCGFFKARPGSAGSAAGKAGAAGSAEESFVLTDFDNARTYAAFGLREEALAKLEALSQLYKSLGEEEFVHGLDMDIVEVTASRNVSKKSNPYIKAGRHYKRGFEYEKRGEYLKAAEEFAKAEVIMNLDGDENDPWPCLNAALHQAMALRMAGEKIKSAEVFASIIRTYKRVDNFNAHSQVVARIGYMLFELGVTLEEAGRPGDAKKTFRRAKNRFNQAARLLKKEGHIGLSGYINGWKDRAEALANATDKGWMA